MNLSKLEPITQKFIDAVKAAGGPPLHELSPEKAHQVLTDLQSKPVDKAPADVEDVTFPVGPTGSTRIRIVRPRGTKERLPVVLYCHGGGWVLGDTITHDRLVREIASRAKATVVFVEYVNSPQAKFPVQNEQAYASLLHVAEHAESLKVDASRIAVVGDSVGGNMAAALTLLSKQRGGPKIATQVLFYPVVDYISENDSYRQFKDGPWLVAKTMKWMFDLEGLDGSNPEVTAFPLRATSEQLRGLPEALIIVDDDILRDEARAYAVKLADAGVPTTCVHYGGTIHDFVMLNPLAETPAARAATAQCIQVLQRALHG